MWPTVYVIDKKGYIRFWWQGELNWQGATIEIDELKDPLGPRVSVSNDRFSDKGFLAMPTAAYL